MVMSILIAFGRWATPHLVYGKRGIRLCLGFVAVTAYLAEEGPFCCVFADVYRQQQLKGEKK